MQHIVETTRITKRFGGLVAVDDVSVQVPSGCAFGYLGPNGAGKTTLIRMLLGLEKPSAGTVRLLGQPVPARPASVLAQVGGMVEEPGFHGHLTGRQNLLTSAACREAAAKTRIDSALRRLGLTERADDRVATYSRGLRQRLGIARCLLGDPQVLILDEPTNGLDLRGVDDLRLLIRGLVACGRTVFLSSHVFTEVEKLCDAIAIVDRGRIVAQGSVAELAAGLPHTIRLGCADHSRALGLLSTHRAIQSAVGTADGIQIALHPGTDPARAAADVNRRLLEAGIDVAGLEIRRVSLQERFLPMTPRQGIAA
ncbi:MAG: ABC transporter ATP-binding protein [Egibacteraceae bacterium]